jgi:hypothetical protein
MPTAKNIWIPRHVKDGIGHKACAYPERVNVFGADTETAKGNVEMIQICDGKCAYLLHANPMTALQKYVEAMNPLVHKGETNVCWFHNLTFDMEVMLIPYIQLYREKKSFEINLDICDIELHMGKVAFVDIFYSKNRRLMLRDSSKFIMGSLEKVAKKLGTPHQKSPKPMGLGVRSPWEPDIKAYAEQDAWVTYEIGDWICKNLLHKYNVPPTVSFSQFSQKLYQSQFVGPDEHIPFPTDDACYFAERSYHGGKNGLYCPAPVVIEECYDVDIVSAYAYSLSKMPQAYFSRSLYVNKYEPGKHGVYAIDACIAPTKYPVLFKEFTFQPAVGEVKDLMVVSYELDRAIEMGLVQLHRCRGWILEESNYKKHAFAPYVDYWWQKKKVAEEGSIPYRSSKLAPNAIYGKLIGRVELDEADFVERHGAFMPVKMTHKACSFYNPLLATLVTAKTRLKLLDLEQRFNGLHSATDAVKTTTRPTGMSSELGGYEQEICGRCVILRNKLYLHFNQENKLEKFALHGFWGTPDQLLEMVDKGLRNYTCKHMPKLRETLRLVDKKTLPFVMKDVEREININFNDWHYIKGDRVSDVSPLSEVPDEKLDITL